MPRTSLAIGGILALAFAAGVDTSGDPRVPMPPRAPTADYGRYLATPFTAARLPHGRHATTDEKLRSPNLLAGGLFLRTPRGEPIYSANLTPDRETGLGAWTADELTRALTTGIGRAGVPQWPPMPVFRTLTPDEGAALWAYLRFGSRGVAQDPGTGPGAPDAHLAARGFFIIYGCTVCHGDRAPYQQLLRDSTRKPVADLAASIRNPERQVVDSTMPTYAAVIDEATATTMAAWIHEAGVKAGTPLRPAPRQ